jgi:hypothetical protein
LKLLQFFAHLLKAFAKFARFDSYARLATLADEMRLGDFFELANQNRVLMTSFRTLDVNCLIFEHRPQPDQLAEIFHHIIRDLSGAVRPAAPALETANERSAGLGSLSHRHQGIGQLAATGADQCATHAGMRLLPFARDSTLSALLGEVHEPGCC